MISKMEVTHKSAVVWSEFVTENSGKRCVQYTGYSI